MDTERIQAAQAHVNARRFADAEALLQQPGATVGTEADRCRLLGVIALYRSQPLAAEPWLRQSLGLYVRPETLDNLGVALLAQGRYAEAEACCRKALELAPDFAIALTNLGTCLRHQGKFTEAIDVAVRSVNLAPDNGAAWCNLIALLRDAGRYESAIAVGRQALARLPTDYEIHRHTADAQIWVGKVSDAIATCRHYLEHRPDDPPTLRKLGMLLVQCMGATEEGMAILRRAVAQAPEDLHTLSGYLCCLQYLPEISPQELLAEHRRWDERFGVAPPAVPNHDAPREPGRPLRIAILTSDLGEHPVARLVIAAFEALRALPCALVAYNDRSGKEAMTRRFQQAFHEWRDVSSVHNNTLIEQIRRDRIDVLFDLAGHTRGLRLPVFAARPAPVQITWLGYQGTTGMRAMDYLLADRHLVPPEFEANYQERILRMPHSYVCWDRNDELAPPVGPLPAHANGFVTFGSFNHPAKITPEVIALWAEILKRVPTARLALRYRWFHDEAVKRLLLERFAQAGVAAERIELAVGWDRRGMLEAYHKIDLALEPFPFSGGMTTGEALWMGVPTLTLPGATFASRQSLSYVATVGLNDFVARCKEDYVERAVSWANRLADLAELRQSLRPRIAASPLADAPSFARDLLALLTTACYSPQSLG
jgi:predicted O-linked N-acetylglucosamine transferase (SPINDLY family)